MFHEEDEVLIRDILKQRFKNFIYIHIKSPYKKTLINLKHILIVDV